ncbi:MAG: protein translocase subunit SecF, partial [Acidobacteriaceae bacterium]|nr:protein translocase subunit SecF [Acidobacteriaceae bacterium]
MLSALNTAFNPNTGGKLDINTIGQTALVDALRGALSKTGGLSDDAIGSLANRILEYRDTPPRSGLIGNLDELSGIPGMTPQILSAIRGSFFPGQFHIGRVEIVGPKIGADLRQQAINVVLIALGAMLVYIAFRFEWIYGVAAVVAVFHDTIITIGLFSLFNKQIDLTV